MTDPQPPKLAADPVLHGVLQDAGRVYAEADQIAQEYRADQLLAKSRLFDVLESDGQRLLCYISGPGGGGIDYSDAAPFGSMLDALGDIDSIDLLIHSPGGIGEVAEKIVQMCRSCCNERFRVIVPNYAKSAATMIALGADAIVMGDRSELGPIDPQYEVAIGGVAQSISGQSFIQAFDDAQEQVQALIAENESPVGMLQSLAASTMEPAFIEHCRRGVAFSRDVARRFLREYQLPAMFQARGETRHANTIRARSKRAAENLLSANTRFSHGRLIGAEEARDEVGLHVEILDRHDPIWIAYWELYVRAEVFMQSLGAVEDRPRVSKLFFDRTSTLPAY
jgi:ATP-dependent protease ClpP protease subunit